MSAIATKRAPPILMDGRLPTASQRRTVLTESPNCCAISVARMYWARWLIAGAPALLGVPLRRPGLRTLQSTREPLGEQLSEQGRSGRGSPGWSAASCFLRIAFWPECIGPIGAPWHGQFVLSWKARHAF